MRTLAIAAGALAFLGAGSEAFGTVEGVLQFDTFKYSSPGLGSSGPVVVYGSRRGDAVSELCVVAFGKTLCLSDVKLAELKGAIINDIQISYEAGPRDYGGRTVHVLLSKGFTSGRQDAKLISVGEFGVVRIGTPLESPN